MLQKNVGKRSCYFSQRNSYCLFLNKSANRRDFLSGFKISMVRTELKDHENKLLTSQKKKMLFARSFYSLCLFPVLVYQTTTPASNSLIFKCFTWNVTQRAIFLVLFNRKNLLPNNNSRVKFSNIQMFYVERNTTGNFPCSL